MIGKSHKFMGAALWFHAVPLLCSNVSTATYALMLTPVAIYSSLLPDMDHPESKMGQKCPSLSRCIASLFGHRGGTHSLLPIGALIAILFSLVSMNLSFYLISVFIAFSVGYVSHIWADWHTVRGVRLFWPWNISFRLPIIHCKTGSEREVFFCAIWTIAGLQCISAMFMDFAPYYEVIYIKLNNYDFFNHLFSAISSFLKPLIVFMDNIYTKTINLSH